MIWRFETSCSFDRIPDYNFTIHEVEPMLKEARELTAIFTAASKTANEDKTR
jgi:hypothetical protein